MTILAIVDDLVAVWTDGTITHWAMPHTDPCGVSQHVSRVIQEHRPTMILIARGCRNRTLHGAVLHAAHQAAAGIRVVQVRRQHRLDAIGNAHSMLRSAARTIGGAA